MKEDWEKKGRSGNRRAMQQVESYRQIAIGDRLVGDSPVARTVSHANKKRVITSGTKAILINIFIYC